MTTEITWTPSSEPGIGKRERGVRARVRARDLGGVRSRLDDHDARSGRGERAVRLDGGGSAVDRDLQLGGWPARPRLVARERESTEPVDRGPSFHHREIDVETRSPFIELDDRGIDGEPGSEHHA